MGSRTSAGILLYRVRGGRVEVLLAHPGGPFHRARDTGNWTVPKGEPAEGEDLELAASREFEEETGAPVPDGPRIALGSVRQKGGKVVTAWAVEGDLDPVVTRSNHFDLEWPRGSGRVESFPEVDRVAWFDPDEARTRIKDAQVPFVDRLVLALERA